MALATSLNKPLPAEPPATPIPPASASSHQRADPAGITLRQHHAAVSSLSDHQVLQASIRAGLTAPPPANVRLAQSPTKIVNSENLRLQLTEFNAFTQLMTPSPKSQLAFRNSITLTTPQHPHKLTDRRPELWVRESQIVPVHKKGTGLGESDDGLYKWAFFRDLEGVIRSACPTDGNAMVKTYRRTRFQTRGERWRNFSFNGRDGQKPWERHTYVNLLSQEGDRGSETKSEQADSRRSSKLSTSIVDGNDQEIPIDKLDQDIAVTCDELRVSNRYSVPGEDFKGLHPPLSIEDPETLRKIADLKSRQGSSSISAGVPSPTTKKEGLLTPSSLWLDGQTVLRIESLRRAHRTGDLGSVDELNAGGKVTNGSAFVGERQGKGTGILTLPTTAPLTQKLLPAVPMLRPSQQSLILTPENRLPAFSKTTPKEPSPTSSGQLTISAVPSKQKIKTFLGTTENNTCTLLREETIQALQYYCNNSAQSFVDLVNTHKSIITLDILHNLNRGPIFTAPMVQYFLSQLVKVSITEYLPLEDLECARDIMTHYLANRGLKIHTGRNGREWKATGFDTHDFNAMNHLEDAYSDRFFLECQELIKVGYGTTMSERITSSAAVTAVLYTSCIAAMDIADTDNAAYAQKIVHAVGLIYAAAEGLVMAAPVPYLKYVDGALLKPLSTEITKRVQGRYQTGVLQACVVKTFRDTYAVGAMRGERIPGMAMRKENEIAGMKGDGKEVFGGLMEKRRELGRTFLGKVRMYVSALGEKWPKIDRKG